MPSTNSHPSKPHPLVRFAWVAASALLLALSVPGVSVVRAEGPAAPAPVAGPTCSDGGGGLAALQPSHVDAMVKQVRERIAEREGAAAHPPTRRTLPDGTVALNGRGYNYASGTGLDTAVFADIQRAAERRAEERAARE